jgi:hypothetical protein
MTMRISIALASAMLLLAGCASTPEPSGPPRYAPVISDLRDAPPVAEQVRENGNVRYFVSENFFGPTLIDLFHREMALHAPALPNRKRVDVTEIEVSILVSGNSYLIDPTHAMLGRERAAIAPAIRSRWCRCASATVSTGSPRPNRCRPPRLGRSRRASVPVSSTAPRSAE